MTSRPPDGPQSRLLDATLTAYVPNQPDRSNPAAVYDAFRDQGPKAQSALAGNGPSDGLLPEVFTTTINPTTCRIRTTRRRPTALRRRTSPARPSTPSTRPTPR